MISPLEMIDLLNWTESDDLEFKSARGGIPHSLWETYSAMANTRGGIILLGVENDRTVSGIKDINLIKTNFWNTINNKSKVNINLLNESSLQEIPHLAGVIVAIQVPRASREQRPIFVGQNPLTGTYRRNAEGDYHCTQQEVGRMLADRSEDPPDNRILPDLKTEDLDLPSLQQYRKRFASLKPTHPWLSEDDKGLLLKLGGYKRLRSDANEGLTVAGLLMFGREEIIREVIPRYQLDYREKLSMDPEVRWTDRITPDGTWAGNLFQFYLRVVQRLSSDLKLPFQLDQDLVRKGETIVHVAIREALVNALIHADYQGLGGTIIEKHVDRFEFSNAGSLLISIEQLLRGNISECRNKAIQTMFTMIGAAEKAGSGVDKIWMGWRSQHWRLPIIKDQVQPERVHLILPMVSLIPEKALTRLRSQFGSSHEMLNPTEIQALITAELEGSVNNSRLRQITDKHPSDITKHLQNLVKEGFLTQDGQDRGTQYYLPSLYPPSVQIDPHSVHMDPHSVHNLRTYGHKAPISDKKWGHLIALANPARQKKKLPHRELERVISDLCKEEWLTKKELGILLQRSPDGLRIRYLSPMKEKGILQLLHPDKPNSSDQAYKSINSDLN